MRIRAVNPDNTLELTRLRDLCHHTYGERAKEAQLIDLDFWRNQLNGQTVSLVAEYNREILGHIAYRPDRHNTKHVQLLLPALAPDSSGIAHEMATAAWETIKKVAERQGWEMVYMYTFVDSPELQTLTHTVVGATDCALIPHFLGGVSDAGRVDVLVSCRVLRDASLGDVYAPAQYVEPVNQILQRAGIERNVIASGTPSYRGRLGSPGFEVHSSPASGTAVIVVRPSLLQGSEELDVATNLDSIETACVLCDANDAVTPSFAETIEAKGFRFAGFIPLLHNQDSLVFWRSRHEYRAGKPLVSPEAQLLDRLIRKESAPVKRARSRRNVMEKIVGTLR